MDTLQVMDAWELVGPFPREWRDYGAQDPAVRMIMDEVLTAPEPDAVRAVLISAPHPGMGATSLALLTAAEFGGNAYRITGNDSVDEIRRTVHAVQNGDVLYIDGLADVGRLIGVSALRALLDDLTVTRPGALLIGSCLKLEATPVLLRRAFELGVSLTPYDDVGGQFVTLRLALRMLLDPLPPVGGKDLRRIARASRNHPRVIAAILSDLRDLALVDESEVHDGHSYDLTTPLRWLGIDAGDRESTRRRVAPQTHPEATGITTARLEGRCPSCRVRIVPGKFISRQNRGWGCYACHLTGAGW